MRKIVLFLMFFVSVSLEAQDFKILFVNTETIKIGGKDLKKGDVFFESDKIVWKDDKQAMKVLSLSDNKQFVFVSTDFEDRKLKSAKEFLVRSNRMSTRGSGSLSTLARQIGDVVYILDTTRIAVNYVPDESEFFYLLLPDGSHKPIDYSDGSLLFTSDVIAGETEEVVGLFFRFSDGEDECVIDELSIVSLPVSITQE